jgi:hypothetical protein
MEEVVILYETQEALGECLWILALVPRSYAMSLTSGLFVVAVAANNDLLKGDQEALNGSRADGCARPGAFL